MSPLNLNQPLERAARRVNRFWRWITGYKEPIKLPIAKELEAILASDPPKPRRRPIKKRKTITKKRHARPKVTK